MRVVLSSCRSSRGLCLLAKRATTTATARIRGQAEYIGDAARTAYDQHNMMGPVGERNGPLLGRCEDPITRDAERPLRGGYSALRVDPLYPQGLRTRAEWALGRPNAPAMPNECGGNIAARGRAKTRKLAAHIDVKGQADHGSDNDVDKRSADGHGSFTSEWAQKDQ